MSRAIYVLLVHGPVEALRRAPFALLVWAMRGWWP
jgi:hypothetical protein